jgi:hypothetical protein
MSNTHCTRCHRYMSVGGVHICGQPLLFTTLILLLAMTACADKDLEKVAKGLLALADGISITQTTVIEANNQGLIDEDTTRNILQVCVKITQAGQDASAVTRALSKLDDVSRTQVLEILKPVIMSVQDALDNGLLGIKNEQTKQKVRATLLTVQTTLNAIQLTLVGGA